MRYSRRSEFPIHGNCVNFSGGLCTLSNVAVDPNGAACPNFIPKSITPQPQIRYSYPPPYIPSPQTWYGYRTRHSSGPFPSIPTAPMQGGAGFLFMSRGRGGRGGGGGRGRRRMGGFAAGPGGFCVCPNCTYSTPHITGTPCYQQTCPKCGSMMTRGD